MGVKEREINTKQRGRVIKKRKPIMLIATEGKNKTETLYFNSYNLISKYSIVFCKGNDTDPLNMIKVLQNEKKKIKEPGIEDKAYCIIDMDIGCSKNKQIMQAEVKAKKANIELIISNPCFEIWYLCHFIYSTKLYNSNDEVINELKKYISNYDKNINIFNKLEGNTNVAISNAKKLERHHKELGRVEHSLENNPSTDVYKIVKEIST